MRAYLCLDYKTSDISYLTEQIRRENVNDVSDMSMMHGVRKITMCGRQSKNAWTKHYERLLIFL